MLGLFPETVRLEDLFTEAVARLFERRPELCLAWLEESGLVSTSHAASADEGSVHVSSQRPFVALEDHEMGSRPDLLIEVYRPPGEDDVEEEAVKDVVMVESKIGAWEGPEQLRRYAEHLENVTYASGKTLLYITRNYDPKDREEITFGLGDNLHFEQLRWHDFYLFLQKVEEKDALTEEVMTFMEEQGMARGYRFSAADLMALSDVPRAFEIFDETLDDEVKSALQSFAGNKVMGENHSLGEMRTFQRYHIRAPLHGLDLACSVGYQLVKVAEETYSSILRISGDGYPAAYVFLEAKPNALARGTSVSAMKRIALNDEWDSFNLDSPADWGGVRRVKSFASILPEEDHVAAVKSFFIESIRQLREELTAFKREHPDSELPWDGGEDQSPSDRGSRFVWGEGDIGLRKPE